MTKRAIALTLLIFAVAFLATLSPFRGRVSAQASGQTTDIYEAFAFESLTVSTTVKQVTTATAFPSGRIGARLATCTTESDAIRYRVDGGDPAANTGHSVSANTTLLIYGTNNIRNFKMIRSGSSDATVRCTYSR